MEINKKLQQLRKEKGLTQEQLAEELYVSRTAISKWESGRGYPSVDSLRAISKIFSISIDDLLSGEELIIIAEADNRKKIGNLRDLVFGVSDCMLALFFFLPFFGQEEHGITRTISLINLNSVFYIKTAFIFITGLTIVLGIAELALQNFQHRLWLKNKTMVSVVLSVIGIMVFILSPQPYAALFLLCLLVMKGVLLIKQQ